MFEVYVEKPPAAAAAATVPSSPLQEHHKTKLTELTISKSDAEGGAEVTVAPTLSFTSFAVLKAQIEALLLSLPGFEEEHKKWRLSSLQFCDDDCKLVALSASTFDPQEFQEPRLPRGQKVYLQARVSALPPATDPAGAATHTTTDTTTTTTTRRQHSTPLPPHAATHGKKTMQAATGVARAPQRRALGRRDANALPVATTPAQTAAAAARDGRGGGTRKKTTRAGKAAIPAATSRARGTAADNARRPRPPAPASHKDRRAATTAAATPQQGRKLSPSSAPANNAGSAGSCRTSRRGRAPAYVFKASSTGDGNGGGRGEARPSSSQPPVLPSGGRQRSSAGGSGAVSAKKPGWNSGNEPMWEEAERKRAIMRKEARARILRKRATAAFKQALGGRAGGSGRGGSARVFRRGRRDCLVTDARRKRLGAYLFCDTIGALPSPLGKRKLDTYRELGRAAAAQMKYLAIADCDPEPKRGRGEGACGGDRAFVVFRRRDTTPTQLSIPAPAAARATGSTAGACAAQKTVADKRIVVVASNAPCSAAPLRKGGAAKAPLKLPAALRPPTARPGDIGFFRGGAGFRMRPPPKGPGRGGSATAAATPAAVRGRDSSTCSGDRVKAGVSAAGGGGQGAAALTAAAAGKVRPRGCNVFVRGTGAINSSSSSSSIRGSARERGGGVVAAKKEAAGVRAKNEDASAAAAIMAKLAGGGGRGSGRGGGGAASSGGEDVESLQEQVALLKAAAGLSDEELTWRMETAKPEANAYRIASAALERAEATYERLLWRQGQLQIARARLTGRGVGGDAATATFATAVSRFLQAPPRREGGDCTALSRLGSASEGVLAALQETPSSETAAAAAAGGANPTPAAATATFPADVAAREVRAAAGALAKLVAAVLSTSSTGSEVDHEAVRAEVAAEAQALRERADEVGRDLAAVGRRVEAAVGQMEAWQQRRAEAPEFAAEEAAKEEAWNEANRGANDAALREMRALLPEAVWDMNAGEIQAAAAAAGLNGEGGVFYPSDLCVRLRECRPLHWLVSAPEDVAGANFLAGDGAAAFTQLEGMDLTEMRAVWSVLPREFSRDADGKKAEWRARFRVQLEGLARQRDGAVVTAGWDPVRGRRATARMPPLPAHRVRHPAYFYPAAEATASRVARLREQRRRLAARKDRLSALETELAEAKREVDAACADARCGELRRRYGAETLRAAREAAKEAHSALARERKSLMAGVAEAEKMLSSTFPSLEQLESEAESIARIVGRATIAKATNGDCNSTDDSNGDPKSKDGNDAVPVAAAAPPGAIGSNISIPVPGAFSEEPELRRRAAAAAKKLTPEEERRLRASEVQRAVSSRGDAVGVVPGDGGGDSGAVPDAGTSGVDAAAADDAGCGVGGFGGRVGGVGTVAAPASARDSASAAEIGSASSAPVRNGQAGEERHAVSRCASMLSSTGDEGGGGGGGGGSNPNAVSESAPAPRRPVKVAPGVLALLTKQHSARAATVAGSGGGGLPAGVSPSAIKDAVAEAPLPPPAAAAAAAASNSPSSGVSAPSRAGDGSAVCVPTAPAPAKPMSKSLAALLARRAADNPPPGSAVVPSTNGEIRGGEGGGGGASKKAAPSSLGFLGELKARAAAKNRGASVDVVPPAASTSEAVVGRKGMAGPFAKGGGSFLEELKARTAKIS